MSKAKKKKEESEGFQVKKAHLYVGLALGIIALLGSFGVGFNLTTPGSTAVAALEAVMNEKDLSIARKHDQDVSALMARIQTMETNILNKVSEKQTENNREQVRLIVQALKNGK